MPASTTIASRGLEPERHGLRRTSVRCVDDEHVGVVEVLIERRPGALQQQDVADRERGLAGARVLALALDGEDDEVAARR